MLERDPPVLREELEGVTAHELAQVNPLAAHGGGIVRLFSCYPPTEDRVAARQQLAGQSSSPLV